MKGYLTPVLVLVALYAVVLVPAGLRRDFLGLVTSERLLGQGLAAVEKNEVERAVALFDEAEKARPGSANVPGRAGEVLLQAGAPEKALPFLERARRLGCGYQAELFYVYALKEAGKNEQALATCRELIRKYPDKWEVLNDCGYLLADGGKEADLAIALQALQKAVELKPNSPAVLDSYGWALFKVGKLKEAEPFLEWAASRSPGHLDILNHLKSLYFAEGRLKDVARLQQKARTSKPAGFLQHYLWALEDAFHPTAPRPQREP